MDNEIIEARFGGSEIQPEFSSFKKAKSVIIQAPYDKTASYKKGTVDGPEAIIDASQFLELFDDELKKETFKTGIYTSAPLSLQHLAPEDMVKTVEAAVDETLKNGKVPVTIGGEHTVSVGCVTAAKKHYPDLSVLVLDSHHDLRDTYEGMKYSHACATRRISEMCPTVLVGARSISKEENDFLQTNPKNITSMDVYEILDTAQWKENAIKALSDNVYLSIDLDVFDPSCMPSVGTPEPGGFGWYEIIDFIKLVAKNKKLIGFDVMELMPITGDSAPDFLAAKLIYRILGYINYIGKK